MVQHEEAGRCPVEVEGKEVALEVGSSETEGNFETGGEPKGVPEVEVLASTFFVVGDVTVEFFTESLSSLLAGELV